MQATLSRTIHEVFSAELDCACLLLFMMLFLTCCTGTEANGSADTKNKIIYAPGNDNMENQTNKGHLSTNDYVQDIVNHQAFKGFGELILPWDDKASYYNTPLTQVDSLMPYHGHVNPAIVVGALNHMIDEVMPVKPYSTISITKSKSQGTRQETLPVSFSTEASPVRRLLLSVPVEDFPTSDLCMKDFRLPGR